MIKQPKEKAKTIKRHDSLQPLSRAHHHGLLLCWKIRTGLKKNVETERIKKYADWFFHTYLLPHFEEEETTIFPLLGDDDPMIKKVIKEHRRLKRLFQSKSEMVKSLSLIEEELEQHIRFEERLLFNKIQEIVDLDTRKILLMHKEEKFVENSEDEFWK